jgi:hypothetical protein
MGSCAVAVKTAGAIRMNPGFQKPEHFKRVDRRHGTQRIG